MLDLNQYLDVFIEEAKEHLQALNHHLLEFEKNPEHLDIVDHIFRSAHTLKGMAATMEFGDIASLTHQMENVLDLIRKSAIKADSEVIEIIFESVDKLEDLLYSVIHKDETEHDVSDLIAKLEALANRNQFTSGSTSAAAEEDTEQNDGAPPESLVQERSFDQAVPVELNEYEQTVMKQSFDLGYTIYYVRVQLNADCILKAARAYMVFDLLDKSGEIIKSVPSVEAIEDEDFESSFELMYVSKENADFLQQMILKVSEISEVLVEEVLVGSAHDNSVMKVGQASLSGSTKPDLDIATPALQETAATAPSSPSQHQHEATKSVHRQTNKTIRVNIDRLDTLMNLFSELVIDRGRLEQLSNELKHPGLEETVEHMGRISGDLQDLVLNMRMVPIEHVFNRFPRMVRGVAKELNKEIDLKISGTETELDRTVIDEIGDPLVHLLRNAIDHGIEHPAERRAAGKAAHGTIHLHAYHSGNHVFIEIKDDGKGIDRQRVLGKAIEKGIVSAEKSTEISAEEIDQFLFHTGFSTADVVSDLSGRGVGLDVVANKIQSIGGIVSVESEQGSGTKFSIQLPLTLSIISAMLVQVGDEKYAIQISSIMETAVYKREQIKTVHGQQVIHFRGEVIPLISMKHIFEVPGEDDSDVLSLIMIYNGEKKAALVVDAFIGQQEIVLKSLGNYLTNIYAISGATILGDGQVALIIDCNSLLK